MIGFSILVALLVPQASAFPSYGSSGRHALRPRQYNIGPQPADDPNSPNGYVSPGPGDVRSPCPALNTLANHGFLPRNGKGISRTQIQKAFVNGFNVGFSVTEVPKENAFNVCQYVTGQYCYTLDLNIIATPHTFEHDHSLSREDYMEAYSSSPRDNHDFNGTIFQTSLNVLQGSSHMTFSQANEVRLQRESLASVSDSAGWFTLAQDTQITELGFIFSIMKDFNYADYLTNPLARVDWWDFWFTYESFPTPLGWARPSVQVDQTFVSSVSSAIRTNQVITSTPTPFASSFLKERAVAPATEDPASPTAIAGLPKTVAPSVLSRIEKTIAPRPTMANPYATILDATQWSSQAAAIESNVAAVQSAVIAG